MTELHYLDNAATTRVRREVLEAMLPTFTEHYGNPSSLHAHGLQAARLLRESRERAAAALGCSPSELIFTSGGTEADNLGLRGVAHALGRRGRHILSSAVEHPAVLETCRELRDRHGFELTELAPDAAGRYRPEDFIEALRPDTILLALMHVQNETGVRHPVEEIARLAKTKNELLVVHVDGVQGAGKLPLNLSETDIDLYAVSGHKIEGPKGVGALVVRGRARLIPELAGGGQERGLRSGTENVPGIVGLARALELAVEEQDGRRARYAPLMERLRTELVGLGAELNSPEDGVPWILSASFPGLPAEVMLHALEARGVLVSSGSACASNKRKASYVLAAMKRGSERASTALRFSLGAESNESTITAAVAATRAALEELSPQRRSGHRASKRTGRGGSRGRKGAQR